MNIYAPTARFDSARALTEDELYKVAPSIFAIDKHESRSDRFQPIPTIEILRALTREGFVPVGARQSGTRDESKREFTKHLIRLRKIEDDAKFRVGDTVCEILLKNANDGSSAYELMAGLFRIACMNSLVAQIGTVESTKVRHSGDVQGKVIEGTYTVLGQAHAALDAPNDWSRITLSQDEKTAFADAARTLRFGDADGVVDTPITARHLLVPRRMSDVEDTLWNVFNRVQENAIRGGLSATRIDPVTNERRRVTTREVKGIDQDVKLNRALWKLTQTMAALKGQAAA